MNHYFVSIRLWIIVWGMLCTQIAIGQIPQSEFDALKRLYNATKGDSWTNRAGWENINTTATAANVNDSWHGLTVVGGHVTKISLTRNNLVGSIPVEIGDFPQLNNLSLSSNHLVGAIPTEIGSLGELISLNLLGNDLTGQIPNAIGRLIKLQALYLGSNQLQGAVPTDIEFLVLLERLSLRNNGFTSIPATINKLTSLSELHLQNNQLTTIPKEIGDLANLMELKVQENQLISIPQELGKLTKIRRIELQDNQLTTLPDLSGNVLFAPILFWVHNNLLAFDSIYPNRFKLSLYSPQNKYTPSVTTVNIQEGSDLTLEGLVPGGSNNRYQWFKAGRSISNKESSSEFAKKNITMDDAGTYVCKVTNSNMSRLTLESKAITVNVIDNTAPALKSTFPSNNQELAIDLTTMSLTFTENIQKGTGELLIKDKSSDQVVQSIDVSTASDIGAILIINITALPQGSYYITTPKGFVKDLSNNLFAGIHDNSTLSFTINKRQKPTITTLSPADNSTQVDATSLKSLVITFSETVRKGAGYVRIRKVGSGTSVKAINIKSTLVKVNGKTVSINLDNPLTDEVGYYVTLPSSALLDIVGNNIAGINDKTTWNFSLGNPTAPLLTQTTPAHQSTGLPVNLASLKMTFSEKIVKGINGYVAIKKVANDEQVLAISTGSSYIGIQEKEVIVTLGQFLEANTQYYVSIPSGTFKDEAGLAFAGINDKTTWTFTTGTSNIPLLSSLSPAHKSSVSTGFNALSITFSEDIQKGSGIIRIKSANDDRTVDAVFVNSSDVVINGNKAIISFDASGLRSNTPYYVTISSSAFKNSKGNDFAGIDKGQWEFSMAVVNGIATLSQGSLKVYPNPTTEIVYIKLKNNPAPVISFEAMDAQGNLVKTGKLVKLSQNSINVSEWPAGKYLLRFYIGKDLITQKVIKK